MKKRKNGVIPCCHRAETFISTEQGYQGRIEEENNKKGWRVMKTVQGSESIERVGVHE
jgi:hypothetical protein